MQNEDLPYLPYWMNQTFFYFCGTFGGHPPQPAGGQIPRRGSAQAAGTAGDAPAQGLHVPIKNIMLA